MNVLSLLGALLVVLKALDVIHLSWWLVLAPFGAQAILMVASFLLTLWALWDRL